MDVGPADVVPECAPWINRRGAILGHEIAPRIVARYFTAVEAVCFRIRPFTVG